MSDKVAKKEWPRELTKEEVEILGDTSMTLRDIADLLDIPRGSLHGVMKKYGVPNRRTTENKDLIYRRREARRLRRNGMTVGKIAEKMGLAPNTVSSYMPNNLKRKFRKNGKTPAPAPKQVRPVQAKPEEIQDVRICPWCRQEVSLPKSNFCVSCGSPLRPKGEMLLPEGAIK